MKEKEMVVCLERDKSIFVIVIQEVQRGIFVFFLFLFINLTFKEKINNRKNVNKTRINR